MNDVLRVNRAQPACDGPHVIHRGIGRHTLFDFLLQISLLKEFHGDVAVFRREALIKNRHHVRIIDGADDTGLSDEALNHRFIAHLQGVDDLQHHG